MTKRELINLLKSIDREDTPILIDDGTNELYALSKFSYTESAYINGEEIKAIILE